MGDSPTLAGWVSPDLGGGGFMIIRGRVGRPPTKGGGVFTIGSLQSKCHAQLTTLKLRLHTPTHILAREIHLLCLQI